MVQTSHSVPAGDLLWRSFERILSFYQLRLSRRMAESQIAIDWNKALTPNDLIQIGKHLGLEVTVHAIAGIDIAELQKPTLILWSDLRSLVALPQDGATPDLWVPDGDIDVDAICSSRKRDLFALGFERKAATLVKAENEEKGATWFWNLFWKYKRDYIDIGLATFFINMFALITPLYSMTVFDRVVPNHAHETLLALTIGMVLAFAFNFGFKIIRGHVLGAVVARIASRLDVDFMDHLLRLSIPSHKLTVGEKFDLFHELQGLRDFFASRLMPAIVDLPFFLLFLLVIYLIAPAVTIVVAVGVVLLLATSLLCRASVNRTAKVHFKEARSKNTALVELLEGASSIRMFNAIGATLFRWQRLAERVAGAGQRSQNMTGLADDLSYTIMSLISVFVIVVGVTEIEKGDLSVGGLVACNILVARTLSPILNLASVFGKLRQSLDSLRVIDNIFRMPAEPKITPDYEPKAPFSGAMRLKDVTFYHPGQVHPTLYHINLDIRPGERVGIIGRTGAGKSTITRLLDGSLEPQTGHVFADNYILKAIHPIEWRQSLGIVPQDPFLFSGSIRENILLGMRDAVDETWLKQVLSMSGLDLVLQQAGYGIDFQVGEGGGRLSGGQKQCLALARALIRRPQILLLDEPTNGMDHDLEQRVRNALHTYLTEKTLVMVTHRTPLLTLVNRIVLIDQGTVAADGPTDDIMRKLSGPAAGGAHG